MILDLVRHGQAVAAHPGGDGLRKLSDRGRREVELLARGLAAGGWAPSRALVSPLARAQETVALLLAGLEHAPAPEVLDALCPDVEPDDAIAAIDAASAPHLLVVSHLPLVERLVARLAGETVGFYPATLIRLETQGPLSHARARVTLTLHPAASTS